MRPLDPRVLPHLRPARSGLLVVVVGSIVAGLLTVAQAFAIGTLVVEVVSGQTGSSWHTSGWWVASLVVVRALTVYVVDVSAATAASRVSTALRRRVVDAAIHLDAGKLSRHRTGELALLATRGTAAVEPYFTRYVPALAAATVLPVAALLAIFWLDWVSGLIVLFTLPLIPMFAVLIGVATRDRANRQWQLLAALSGHFLDVVRGLPTLVAYRRASAQSATIRTVTDRYRRATVESLKLTFASSVVLELIATVSVALVAVSVGLRLSAGDLDFRTALIVLLLAPEAYWPLRRVGAEFHAAAEGTASFEAADRLLSHPTEPAAGPGERPNGPIELESVRVAYGDRTVLDGVSATIEPGLTAIVGPSGCGKTTLLRCLVREVRPEAGAVRVGGVDLAGLDPEQWRAQLAWAPQRPWLGPGTVSDNVRLGRPDASDEEAWRALEQVGLGPTVANLPSGMDTPLGQDGADLSAGQRARVALARVVLANRAYVFLDEPTAHLDDATEAVFLETLRTLALHSTVVVVAHRPAVAEAADLVITLATPLPVPRRDSPRRLGPAPRPLEPQAVPDDHGDEEKGRRFGARTGVVLGALSTAAGVALTATSAWLITRASEHPQVLELMVAIVAVRAFGLARPVLRYAERLVSHDAALRMLAKGRAHVYDAVVPLVPGRLGVRRGDLLTSVVDDVDALVDRQLRVVQPLWTAALVGVGASIFAGLFAPQAGQVTAAVVVVATLGTIVARLLAERAEQDYVRERAALSARTEEVLAGARQLVVWQATAPAMAAIDRAAGRLGATARRSARGRAGCGATVTVACGLGLVATAALVPAGTTSPAMLALLVMLPFALTDSLLPTVDAGVLSVRTRAAGARLAALTRTQPAAADPPDPAPLPTGSGVEVDSVAAAWGERDALRGVSFSLPPGARIGVVGPSGSGKSTLAALLLRFLDPRLGAISLADTDLRHLALDDVRRRVGLVDDDPYIFRSTIAENVRLARPDADDHAVEAALRSAQLGEWLDALPDGPATLVGEGHRDVSGGERARIGIARAILADQPVLVLDEPTAHLDTATALAVAGDVLAVRNGRSILWITHGTIGLDEMDELVRLGAEDGLGSLAAGSVLGGGLPRQQVGGSHGVRGGT